MWLSLASDDQPGGGPPRRLTKRELYTFDTRGFLVEPAFISDDECREIASALEPRWPASDEPAWIQRINDIADEITPNLPARIVAQSGIYDTINQPFRMTENYALRQIAGSTRPLHNGRSNVNQSARGRSHRAMWRDHTYHDGLMYCMMVKALVYLSDIAAPEDGPLAVVEGSHKANYEYVYSPSEMRAGAGLQDPNTTWVHCRAGDLVLLNEALTHGAAAKSSPGDRILLAFSFSPSFVSDYVALPKDSTNLSDLGFCE